VKYKLDRNRLLRAVLTAKEKANIAADDSIGSQRMYNLGMVHGFEKVETMIDELKQIDYPAATG